MNKIKTVLSIILVSLAMQSCSTKSEVGYYKGYEIPSYKVTKKIGNVEFRQYEPRLVAEIDVKGERKKAVNEGFIALLDYISGKNITEKKVDMTSPVLQKETSEKLAMTSPVNQTSKGEKQWTVQFGMPKQYKISSLPKPKDSRIKLKTTESKRAIAIRFSGFWSNSKFDEKKAELESFVKDQNLVTKGSPTFAYYDDPFTFPWNRRNEIIWDIK